MPDEQREAVQRIYEAFSRWDVDEMLRDVTHDFELTLPETVPFGGTRHGPDGVQAFATLFQDHVEGGFADPDDFLEAGDRLVVLGRIKGRAKKTGRDFEVPFAHVWAFSAGVPWRCRSYFDTAPIMEAIEA